ncbi:hypothetical protein ACLOJK_032865 [Asimina triloba]
MAPATATHSSSYCPNYFIFFVSFLIVSPNVSTFASGSRRSCRSIQCDAVNGTKISYPFWVSTQHPACRRGPPPFELFCTEANQTAIHLPSADKFYVSEIQYERKLLIVTDPGECLHRRIMDLNLSRGPFHFPRKSSRNATYLNCSQEYLEAEYRRDFKRIDCIEGKNGRYVFVANSSISLSKYPRKTCQTIDTFQLSTDAYQYDPLFRKYVYDNSSDADDRLYLTWDLDEGMHL